MHNNNTRLTQSAPKPVNPPDLIASIRDLVVYLHRGNESRSEAIVTEIIGRLKDTLLSKADPNSVEMRRAQQTMFAMDEVRILLGQRDLRSAVTAARDAAKEWTQERAKSGSSE